jgi:hypothetical protein
MYIKALLFLLLACSATAQISILSEDINGNEYSLTVSLDDGNYNIIEKNNRKIIYFPEFYGESLAENLILPSRDIFIALPPNQSPEIDLQILEKEIINAEPQLTPLLEISKDSVVIYKERTGSDFRINTKAFTVKGYLWIGNNYVVHISINQFQYNFTERNISVNKKVKINFRYPNEIIRSEAVDNSRISNDIILNRNSAALWASKPNIQINNSDDWIDYSSQYVKLGTAQDGIYKIDFNDLSSLGINIGSIDPRTFKILNNGEEVPIYVSGEDDFQFNTEDYIEFVGIRNMGGNHREVSNFGEPYNEYLGRYTDTTIYWLTWGGEIGMRAEYSGNDFPNSEDSLSYYYELIHIEFNNWFDFSMADLVRRESPFWYENKTWHEGNLAVTVRNRGFSVSNVYPNQPVKLFTKLQSFASSINQNAHLLAISLGAHPVQDSGYIDKYQQKVLYGEYNSNLLVNGNNNLRVHSFPTAAFPNTCIVDWYEIEYPRYIRAVNDSLNFSFNYLNGSSLRSYKIQNILTDNFSIWKYGSSFKKYDLSRSGQEVSVVDTINSSDKFVFRSGQKILTPKIYYAKQFKNLRSPENSADYLIITHKKFLEKSEEYSQFISSNYNVVSKIIDVDDIYDEYAYGYFNPESIKEFLKSTHAFWQAEVPQSVFLVGAATYDYHKNKTKFQGLPPVNNFVPSYGASVSDNWFVTWDTTGAFIPQMNIGRLPVNTVEEFDRYLIKHTEYLSKPFDEWNKNFIFFSGGQGNNQSQLDQLREVNNFVINNYVVPPPIGGNPNHFYKTINPNTNFGPYSPEHYQNVINNGSVFISYIGHSGTQTWDNSITEPSQLRNNKNRKPLITDFGCSTARFAEPDITSFSQLFVLAPEGQAIAYIGNSSLGFLSTSVTAPKLFYRRLLIDSVYNISEALKLSKLELLQTYGSGGVYQLFALTNTLIGDPIINLSIPQKPNLSINASDVSYQPELPSDNSDSLSINIRYFNLGIVIDDSLNVLIEDFSGDTLNYTSKIRIGLPHYSDSLTINIPILGKSGEHTFKIHLDSDEEIEEIYETDNLLTINYNVANSSIRSLFSYKTEQELKDTLLLLNPSFRNEKTMLEIEFSADKEFSQPVIQNYSMENFYTRIPLDQLNKETRHWFRAKLQGEASYGLTQSFYLGNTKKYLINDDASFSSAEFMNLKYDGDKIELDSLVTNLSILSAGFFDGKTAIISYNGQNLIPENTLGGHHIGVFDANTFEFLYYKLFDRYQTPNFAAQYETFLDTLSSDVLVLIAVSDEGRITEANLRTKIKTLGSIYIDSLVFRGSWAIIGQKGAEPGSVPEGFTIPFAGRVEMDTTISIPNSSGEIFTSSIGPAAVWGNINFNYMLPQNSDIKFRPLGITREGSVDTLSYLLMQDSTADLSVIDASVYPFIKINAEFSAGDGGVSPSLSSLGVNYKSVPELGTNYQVVSISKDSIMAGDSLSLDFYVYNVGGAPADSFNVMVSIIKPNNQKEIIFNAFVASLYTFSREKFSVSYLSGGQWGNTVFDISIDPDNKIVELYKDNNSYQIPFYIRQDTTITSINEATLAVSFDGIDIIDGDFISPTPEINIILKYPTWFPIGDTTAVEFYLNNNPINYSQLEINYDTVNRTITYSYNPALSDGEHVLRVYGQNIIGNIESMPGYEKLFMVANDLRLVDVYNYPNPFTESTHFTFRLSQIPDELRIKIYTIAGRLIKEISKNSSELTFDFNKIFWDGRDADGDIIANGTYFYKFIVKLNDRTETITEKLVIAR